MLLASNLRRVLTSVRPFKTVSTSYDSFILRKPPSSAPREVPTPLVFVSAAQWDPNSGNGLTTVSSMLAEKGFTCLQVDLSPPTNPETLSSNEITAHFESGLRSAIRSAMIPFAPVIIARSAACIIAQAYISSNPAIGIFLVAPDASNQAVPTKLLPTTLEEFRFEATFPIAVMGTHAEMDVLKSHSRLGKESTVDLIETSELSDRAFLTKLESWLENLGV